MDAGIHRRALLSGRAHSCGERLRGGGWRRWDRDVVGNGHLRGLFSHGNGGVPLMAKAGSSESYRLSWNLEQRLPDPRLPAGLQRVLEQVQDEPGLPAGTLLSG